MCTKAKETTNVRIVENVAQGGKDWKSILRERTKPIESFLVTGVIAHLQPRKKLNITLSLFIKESNLTSALIAEKISLDRTILMYMCESSTEESKATSAKSVEKILLEKSSLKPISVNQY